MEEIRIQGICLSTLSCGDSDLLLTILSEEHGLTRVYAKGIHRPAKRAQIGACRPGCIAEWELRRGRADLFSFVGADLLYYPSALFENWEQLHDVLLMFQSVRDTQWTGKPIPALYALVVTFMRQFEVGWSPALLPAFLLKLLRHDGVFPFPHLCQVCEQPDQEWGWSDTGGLLCHQHRNPQDPSRCQPQDLERWEQLAHSKSFEAMRLLPVTASDRDQLLALYPKLLMQS